MRLSLKRPADAAPRKPLRERIDEARARLTDTKVRAGKALAVARILMKPEAPKPASAVDRVALVNYATFLALERDDVAAELYPHMSAKARRFTLGMNAAWRFFHDSNQGIKPRKDLAAPSTRALAVLDLVGIDWCEDIDAESRHRFDDGGRADTGERPVAPSGTPAADAALVEAADDLTRLDRAIDALCAGDDDRSLDEVPGYSALDAARVRALSILKQERPSTLFGFCAKARAILSEGLRGDPYTIQDVAKSLARDLLGAHHSALEPRPDPIFAAIAENERLEAEADAFERTIPDDEDLPTDAVDAVTAHLSDVVLKTVPTTAEGCKALARFLPAWFERWGSSIEDDAPKAFALIARSPLL